MVSARDRRGYSGLASCATFLCDERQVFGRLVLSWLFVFVWFLSSHDYCLSVSRVSCKMVSPHYGSTLYGQTQHTFGRLCLKYHK